MGNNDGYNGCNGIFKKKLGNSRTQCLKFYPWIGKLNSTVRGEKQLNVILYYYDKQIQLNISLTPTCGEITSECC